MNTRIFKCCPDPRVRGGMCVNCGTWISDAEAEGFRGAAPALATNQVTDDLCQGQPPAPLGDLRRIGGPPPIEDVPDDAIVLTEHRGNGGPYYAVLKWRRYEDDDPPSLQDWYEGERGICGASDVVAHYRLSPPEWACENLNLDPYDLPDDSMDGDHESALASAGWGTDEDYGDFGGGEDF